MLRNYTVSRTRNCGEQFENLASVRPSTNCIRFLRLMGARLKRGKGSPSVAEGSAVQRATRNAPAVCARDQCAQHWQGTKLDGSAQIS